MRYSLEHKAQNHEKILSVAARSFRERGGDSSGIGTVMKKVGLTKGGFYRHFKSKDDLFVEAVARALDETGRGMVEVAKSAAEGQALRAIIERYLSVPHANSLGTGCVISTLGLALSFCSLLPSHDMIRLSSVHNSPSKTSPMDSRAPLRSGRRAR